MEMASKIPSFQENLRSGGFVVDGYTSEMSTRHSDSHIHLGQREKSCYRLSSSLAEGGRVQQKQGKGGSAAQELF
jgi:hypothetical protein